VQTSDITSDPSQVPHNWPEPVKHWRERKRKPVLQVDEHPETVKFVHVQYGHGLRTQGNVSVWVDKPGISQQVEHESSALVVQLLV